ncbi:MAG: recombinase family protein [Cryobacterium sp.]|nr:recombinase family protein [Cryobacterium sp.]
MASGSAGAWISDARASRRHNNLDRHLDALGAIGIPSGRIYVDERSGATTKRPAHTAALDYPRHGDVIVVHTLDTLGHTVRDTLNLIYELKERGVCVRNLTDPIRVDSADPADPCPNLRS